MNFKKTGLRPLVWMRYIDDIFFIWTHDDGSLQKFIEFANNFTSNNQMKSNIKFETHISRESVNFLDVKVNFQNGVICYLGIQQTNRCTFISQCTISSPHSCCKKHS